MGLIIACPVIVSCERCTYIRKERGRTSVSHSLVTLWVNAGVRYWREVNMQNGWRKSKNIIGEKGEW